MEYQLNFWLITFIGLSGYNILKDDKDIIKSKNIIVHSTTNFVDTRIATFKGR